MSAFYLYGQGVTVTTEGPGNIHLLSYASNASVPAIVGTTTTTTTGTTRFIISHSYTFEKFAFYWDGPGTALCGRGQEEPVQPVGTSWADATSADWNAYEFGTADVTSESASAVDMSNRVTCFIISA